MLKINSLEVYLQKTCSRQIELDLISCSEKNKFSNNVEMFKSEQLMWYLLNSKQIACHVYKDNEFSAFVVIPFSDLTHPTALDG